MSTFTCPACAHTFDDSTGVRSSSPDSSVLQWFRSDPPWLGELATSEVYSNYLQDTAGRPVSRERFVADLKYLGVEEVLDGEESMLIRD